MYILYFKEEKHLEKYYFFDKNSTVGHPASPKFKPSPKSKRVKSKSLNWGSGGVWVKVNLNNVKREAFNKKNKKM